MINNLKKKSAKALVFGVLASIILCFSCENTDLVETFDQYIPESVVSLAMPDSVAVVQTDYNKVLFKVYVNSDPKIKKVVVALFDDDTTDDDDKIVTTIDVNRTIYQPEIYEVELDLPEGGNEYFIHIEDSEGKQSIKYDVFGSVLGDAFKESLQARQNTGATIYSDSEAIINWTSNRDTNDDGDIIIKNNLLIKTEISYTSSVDGSELTIVVDESEDATIIPDFISEGTYTYTTFYKVDVDSPYVFESNPTEGTFPVKI
ncbi:DUF4998 domain-containing protein [Algibacter sp. AS12]|uniref:DUF4998 domain-containing protein n=1 Tax=Algibacter sp. AS12 TaxID=3135773 RepID=UPI00398A9444